MPSMAAPASSSSRMASRLPQLAARFSAGQRLGLPFIDAPADSKTRRMSLWPFNAANARGVCPLMLTTSRLIFPSWISAVTQSRLLYMTATYKADMDSPVVTALQSAPPAIRARMQPACPMAAASISAVLPG